MNAIQPPKSDGPTNLNPRSSPLITQPNLEQFRMTSYTQIV